MSDFYSRDGYSRLDVEPDGPTEGEPLATGEETAADAVPQYTVGDELRMRREAMGRTIADVVDAVRIQSRYLEALEDGRLEDLPGTVYALGFVRTYAEFLGLDGNEVVTRYKDETQGLKAQSYVMPEPLEEGKVPTAAILLVAIVLAAAAYGGWYFYTQRSGGRLAQEVPDVPERLSAVTEVPAPSAMPPVSAPEDATRTMPAPVAKPAPAPAEVEPAPPVAAAPAAPPPAEPVASTPVQAAPQPAQDATLPAPEPAEPIASMPAPPAPEPVEPVASAPVQTATSAQPESPAPAESMAPAPPPAAATPETSADVVAAVPPVPSVAEEVREPRVYGLDNVGARIVITAEEDAWLEVTDSDDARLFSRVLRAGDSYHAPNREGAKFVTGNAGGLKITVDGEAVPALGPPGQVRRDVKLDPDLLKAGRAWP